MGKRIYKTEEEKILAQRLNSRRHYERHREEKKAYQREYARRKREEIKIQLEELQKLKQVGAHEHAF